MLQEIPLRLTQEARCTWIRRFPGCRPVECTCFLSRSFDPLLVCSSIPRADVHCNATKYDKGVR